MPEAAVYILLGRVPDRCGFAAAIVSARLPESIDDGVSGVSLDRSPDLDLAVQATVTLLTNGQRAGYLAAEARRSVTQGFDWAISETKTEAIYQQLLSEVPGRSPHLKQVFP